MEWCAVTTWEALIERFSPRAYWPAAPAAVRVNAGNMAVATCEQRMTAAKRTRGRVTAPPAWRREHCALTRETLCLPHPPPALPAAGSVTPENSSRLRTVRDCPVGA